ncbi:Vesicle transport protein [Tyrophagus putrescentiae]|nr:Vesicle transport protein [Tyrophagus putrescentiae]
MNFFKGGQEEEGGRRNTTNLNPLTATIENAAIPHKSLFPELGLYTRIKLFAGFLLLSLLLDIIGIALITINIKSFAALFTLGTLCMLFSIMFLVGPMEQIKAMVQLTRVLASLTLLLCIVLTLVSALHWRKSMLAIIFCIGQFAAFLWYALSYVPYAGTLFKHVGASCCSV